MKCLAGWTLLLCGILWAGCAGHPKKPVTTPMVAPRAIVTADTSMAATVAMYNPVGRFVVLNFPVGGLPRHDQIFFIYHGGLKAGEAKITGPERDNSVVADLISGTAQTGDEVRDQ
jgi:hypothetical protein